MGKVKLEEVVAGYISSNNLGKAEYSRLYQIGIKGIKALNQDVTGQAKVSVIYLDKKLTGKLPEDFLNEVKVHVEDDDSAGLLKDNNLYFEEDEEDEYMDCAADFGNLSFDEEPTYGNGGINWIGKYRIDKERERIYVNPGFCYSCVVLVYLGKSQTTAGGEWLVDSLAEEALEAYIRWKDSLGKNSIGLYQKETNRRNWLKEKRLAKARMKNIARSQLQQNARSSVKYKVKF